MAGEKLFKTFEPKLIKALNFKFMRSFHYWFESEKNSLTERIIDSAGGQQFIRLEDEERRWNVLKQEKSLFLDLTISCENIVHIFYNETKVCYENTILGLGIEWKAADSKIRYCKKLGEINNALDKAEFSLSNIEIENAGGDISLSWFIYISRPGTVDNVANSDAKYANSEGLILVREKFLTVVSTGRGSLFPIEEYPQTGRPLWSIRLDFSDWEQDDFSSDNLAIMLNPTHPLFPMINYESETFDELIFKEAMSSALSTLICQIMAKVREKSSLPHLPKDVIESNGSILAALRYFRDVHSIKVEDQITEVFKSVKLFFDKEKSL